MTRKLMIALAALATMAAVVPTWGQETPPEAVPAPPACTVFFQYGKARDMGGVEDCLQLKIGLERAGAGSVEMRVPFTTDQKRDAWNAVYEYERADNLQRIADGQKREAEQKAKREADDRDAAAKRKADVDKRAAEEARLVRDWRAGKRATPY